MIMVSLKLKVVDELMVVKALNLEGIISFTGAKIITTTTTLWHKTWTPNDHCLGF